MPPHSVAEARFEVADLRALFLGRRLLELALHRERFERELKRERRRDAGEFVAERRRWALRVSRHRDGRPSRGRRSTGRPPRCCRRARSAASRASATASMKRPPRSSAS